MPDYIGSGGVVNPIFQRLTGWLSNGANGAPTLRFGGESTDHTWWNPTGAAQAAGHRHRPQPRVGRQLNQWVTAARTPLVLGLNMGLGDPQHPAAAAAARCAPGCRRTSSATSSSATSPTSTRPRAPTRSGATSACASASGPRATATTSTGARSTTTSPRSTRPRRTSAWPAAASRPGSWDDLQDSILSAQPSVRTWSAHAYPLQTCDKNIRRRGGAAVHPQAARAERVLVDRRPHAPPRRGRRVARRASCRCRR